MNMMLLTYWFMGILSLAISLVTNTKRMKRYYENKAKSNSKQKNQTIIDNLEQAIYIMKVTSALLIITIPSWAIIIFTSPTMFPIFFSFFGSVILVTWGVYRVVVQIIGVHKKVLNEQLG